LHPDTPGGDVATVLSLTRTEARERARLVAVERYDVAVDMTDLVDGTEWRATSRIAFRCAEPGAETFVDCVGTVRSATLNGEALPPESVAGGRILLTGLAAENVLEVSSVQTELASQSGIQRSVDASDGEVYVWTTFEPDDARRVWACFDQPDLKAPHAFTVLAPATWIVRSNRPVDSVEDAEGRTDGARRWSFPDTPALSPYVTVVNAGPFHEIRVERDGWDVGLHCRRSLAPVLERDAEDLVDLTVRGLALFGESFGRPFDQRTYDTVFVPDMPGAMENWGCVTWGDFSLYRSTPTARERAYRGEILLHEMAHMWFGDLVTMQWWDDLWLNEAFASWASTWAAVNATEYTDGWATFLAGLELSGYATDMGPASHPIRGDVPDVAQAMANFDAITYVKGQSVLRQLVAYVGEDAFVEGLRAYFREHAWGNTRLADLMTAVGAASGRDLTSWTEAWFDRAGTDTLVLSGTEVLATGPDGDEPRPHHLEIGVYRRAEGEAGLEQVGTAHVETTGSRTPVEGLPEGADLYQLNHQDLTFAAVRTDERSLRTMLDSAADLPDALSRALAVTTAWDMLQKGELSTDELLTCVLGVLRSERSPGVVEPFLSLSLRAAEQWSAAVAVPGQLARLAEVAAGLAEDPEHRAPALRTLAAAATEPAHFEVLDAAAADNFDLAWRVQARRAALGRHDAAAVEALLNRDPDPDAWIRALGVTAARPEESAKAEVWAEVWEKRSVPAGTPLFALGQCFWRPAQHDLMVPWAHRYLDEVGSLSAGGGMLAVGSLMRGMMPTVADQAFVERAREIAQQPEQNPTVRATLLSGSDTLSRVLRAQA
jgi:aminopeptidase N